MYFRNAFFFFFRPKLERLSSEDCTVACLQHQLFVALFLTSCPLCSSAHFVVSLGTLGLISPDV